MPIIYIPVSASTPLRPSANQLIYPGIPDSSKIVHSYITLQHLMICGTLDLMQGAPLPEPINITWLESIYRAALDDTIPDIQARHYQAISFSWKRALSETIANATSLAVAIFEEGYDWPIPVTLCKNTPSLPEWWPWKRLGFSVEPFPPLKGNMPDFLIGRVGHDGLRLSTLEVKGRDMPVHTKAFDGFSGMKAQSMNAQLYTAAGLPGPALERKILSIVAVRPGLATAQGRTLRCRWFNHANESDPLPVGSLAQIVITQATLLCRRLFGNAHLLHENRIQALLPWNFRQVGIAPVMLKKFKDGYIVNSSEADSTSWRPFISQRAVNFLQTFTLMYRTLLRYSPTNLPIDDQRFATRQLILDEMDQISLRHIENFKEQNYKGEPIFRIGIGLTWVD